MREKTYLAMVISLIIISATLGSPIVSAVKSPTLSKSALTPPTNEIVFLYLNGGAPEYTKAQLDTFFSSVLEPFSVKDVTDVKSYSELENATVLMLLGQTDLSSIDMKVLAQFLIEGGSLLIALPTTNFSVFDPVLELFALKTYGSVLDNLSYYENKTNVIVNNSYMITEHPLINSMFGNVSKVVIPNGVGIRVEDTTPLINATIKSYSLAWGLNSTFIDENNNGEQDADEPYGKNISLIHVIETWFGGKVIILPSIKMIIDEYLLNPEFDNLIWAKALAYWLGNQIAYLSIRGVSASPTFLNVKRDKLVINVTVTVTDENNNTLSDIQVNACLVRLGRVIVSERALRIDSSSIFSAQLNVSKVKPGIAYIYILAYKKYYGYFWAAGPRITLYKPPVTIASIPTLTLAFGAIVPLLTGLMFAVYVLPEYWKKRRGLKAIEEKLKKEK